MIRLLGIYREKECSPGRHQSNDARLLEAVADRLRARGCHIDLTTIDRRPGPLETDRRPAAALVFSMCQGRAALERLLAWERDGARIVNSPRAALNTYRDRLPALMAKAGVPFPQTTLVSTNGHDPARSGRSAARNPALDFEGRDGGFWLKRGDVHASVSRDVQWIDSSEALEAGFAEFQSRGIAAAAVQAHRTGDEIKFYAVAGGAFFHWFYSGASHGYAFDSAALPRLASRAAHAAGLEIFGGDVIVSPSGEPTLIDLNDWPSFAPCREAAAEAIADYLARRAHVARNPGLVSSANQSAV